MSSTKVYRNTYEEVPDRLRDLVAGEQDRHSRQPTSRPSRDTLLRQHARHLKLLNEGNVPIRTLVLPTPYPPSRVSLHDSTHRKIYISDLNVETRDPSQILLLRSISQPYVYSSTVTIVEDEQGDVARFTVCNLEDNMIDPIITQGSVLAVKQPCWTRLVDGGYHIRVDHPCDVVLLRMGDSGVPSAWRNPENIDYTKDATQWKKEGDMMFLKKRFRVALELYDRGLAYLSSNPDPVCAIDLYRKRCGVNIVLLRLDDAAEDLSNAISIHARSTPSLAASELVDQTTIKAWLHSHSTEDLLQISERIPRALKELAARIKFDLGLYQDKPEYNFPLISSYVGPLTLHVDAANYTCDAEVRQTTSHGRGLFAKKAFKAGELISAEKAFVLPGYFMQDRSSDCLLYSLADGTAAPRPGAWLFKELVQKLRWNRSLRREFFDLDDGGYWNKHGWEVPAGEDVPVDVFRIEFIRRYNSFSVPTRSSDLLHQVPNTNPELRNGFWIQGSYVNHSCLPNSVRTFIGDIRFLRATRDIAAGEEITNQYISPEIDILDRQEKYRSTWGFDCDCKLCVADGEINVEVRNERMKRFEELKGSVLKMGERGTTVTSIKKIARGVRELEALYSPTSEGETDRYSDLPRLALVHPSLFLTEAWRGVKNVDKMMEFARKLLRNFGIIMSEEGGHIRILSNAGLINVEAVRALRYFSEGYAIKEDPEMAKKYMELARTWFVIITGAEVGMEEFLNS